MAESGCRHVALIYQKAALPWVFDEAVARGIDITLVPIPGDNIGEGGTYPPGVVRTQDLDIFQDYEGSMAALMTRHAERPFDGVLTLREPAVPFVADLAERLGLPGIGRDAAYAARDKSEMRRRFNAHGLNCPGYVYLGDEDDWRTARQVALPVVVKPAGGFSSQGVIRVDREEELSRAVSDVAAIIRRDLPGVARTPQRDFTGILVEEYIDGHEYAVETFAVDGVVHVLSIADKGHLQGPHFEERVYISPAPLSDSASAAIVDEVSRATLALGIADGPTHTELRLKDGTTPYVFDIGARLGGSGVSHYLVSRSRGVSLVGSVLEFSTGANLSGLGEISSTPPIQTANCYIVPCRGSGTIRSISGLDGARGHPSTEYICQFLFPGDSIPAYPAFGGYPAFVLSRHKSYEDAVRFNDFLDRTVRVQYE